MPRGMLDPPKQKKRARVGGLLSPDDEMLTLRAMRKNNIANEIIVARDGAEHDLPAAGLPVWRPQPCLSAGARRGAADRRGPLADIAGRAAEPRSVAVKRV